MGSSGGPGPVTRVSPLRPLLSLDFKALDTLIREDTFLTPERQLFVINCLCEAAGQWGCKH